MSKWITNWTEKGVARWGTCNPAKAAEIAAEGRCRVRLVSDDFRVTRYVIQIPRWAQTFEQLHPAVALARRLSPLDLYRAEQEQRRSRPMAA